MVKPALFDIVKPLGWMAAGAGLFVVGMVVDAAWNGPQPDRLDQFEALISEAAEHNKRHERELSRLETKLRNFEGQLAATTDAAEDEIEALVADLRRRLADAASLSPDGLAPGVSSGEDDPNGR